MRKSFIFWMIVTSAHGTPINSQYAERLATAIYHAEGGAKSHPAYGIRSVTVRNEDEARKVCLTTIKNNWRRWKSAGAQGDYLEFLARRYCPPNSAAWLKNVRFFLNKS
jgi:hypothetical protein